MSQPRYPLADLRGFGPAARASSQVMFDLPGLQRSQLSGEMGGKMPRNMPREHR
jgi:hypothetical protein